MSEAGVEPTTYILVYLQERTNNYNKVSSYTSCRDEVLGEIFLNHKVILCTPDEALIVRNM